MDSRRRQCVKEELERFATLMGLDRLTRGGSSGSNPDDGTDYLNNNELLCMYLAWSTTFAPWTRVYKAMQGLSLSLDQLLQAARKTGHSSSATAESGGGKARQIHVVAQMFCGAAFSEVAKQTVLYQELQDALVPIDYCTALSPIDPCSAPVVEVLAFHLVGTSNLVALIEDPQSPFVLERISGARREALVEKLRALHAKWTVNNQDQVGREAAIMIQECSYPVLSELGELDILGDLRKRQQRLARPAITSVDPATSSRPKNKTALDRQGSVGLKVHGTVPWTMADERVWAEYAPFKAYKRRKGWRPFYPARDTILAYLADMSAGDATVMVDCKAMNSQEVIEFVGRLAPHVEGAEIFTRTQQGLDFLRAMSATATLQQMSSWSTVDAAQRMLVAHRPDWQTHYAYAWNLDRTTSTEISAYLERWPRLPEKLLAEQADTGTDNNE